jgi:1-acyl-sn-glycerol-3-phosphate acyltransferase
MAYNGRVIRRAVGKVFEDPEVADKLDRLPIEFNAFGVDRFGVSRRSLLRWYSLMAPIYRRYLKVSVFGAEHLPARTRGMVVGNHSGGIGADAQMLATALLMNEPPRLAHAMAEYFFNTKPYAGMWLNRVGHLTGLPEHARLLLEAERLVVVFPEGARGALKPYKQAYQLQRFGTGFMRLALMNKAPVVPFAFIGAEEAFPILTRVDGITKVLGTPPMPIAPQLVFWPLPVSCQIHFGEPMVFEGTGAEPQHVIEGHVERVREAIAGLIERGLALRPRPFATQRVEARR